MSGPSDGNVPAVRQREAQHRATEALGERVEGDRVGGLVEGPANQQHGHRDLVQRDGLHTLDHLDERRDGQACVAGFSLGQFGCVDPLVAARLAPLEALERIVVGRRRVDGHDRARADAQRGAASASDAPIDCPMSTSACGTAASHSFQPMSTEIGGSVPCPGSVTSSTSCPCARSASADRRHRGGRAAETVDHTDDRHRADRSGGE